MAVDSRAVTVTTTATKLDTQNEMDRKVGSAIVVSNTGSVTVYIGGPNVTTTSGIPLAAGGIFSDDGLIPGDDYYGVVASGSSSVVVVQRGI